MGDEMSSFLTPKVLARLFKRTDLRNLDTTNPGSGHPWRDVSGVLRIEGAPNTQVPTIAFPSPSEHTLVAFDGLGGLKAAPHNAGHTNLNAEDGIGLGDRNFPYVHLQSDSNDSGLIVRGPLEHDYANVVAERFLGPQGSVTEPTFAFKTSVINQGPTGFFSPSLGSIGITSNSQQTGVFTPDARFGLNTTAPNAQFDVVGNAAVPLIRGTASASTTLLAELRDNTTATKFSVGTAGQVLAEGGYMTDSGPGAPGLSDIMLGASKVWENTTTGKWGLYTNDGGVIKEITSYGDALLRANNLSDLTNVAAARTNLGLGTAAVYSHTAFATAAQGLLADSAIQPGDINTLAGLNSVVTDATLIDTNDPRLSDARTPLPHTHPISDVINLQTTLDAKADLVNGVLATSQVPALAITEFIGEPADEAAMLALTGQWGDWVIRQDLGTVYVLTADDPSQITSWRQLSYPGTPVISVNGQTGVVVLSHADVGAASLAQGILADGSMQRNGQNMIGATATFTMQGNSSSNPTMTLHASGTMQILNSASGDVLLDTNTRALSNITTIDAEEDIRTEGSLGLRGRYDSGLTLYAPSNGVFARTDIQKTSGVRMFTLSWRVNTYSTGRDPGETIVQGYWYPPTQTFINCSAVGSDDVPNIHVFFENDYLCFWTTQASPSSTFSHFSLHTHTGRHKVTQLSNIAKPSPITNEVTVVPSKRWTSRNDGAGSGLDADLLDGEHGAYYLDLANVTGTLPVPRGGTGSGSHGTNEILLGDGVAPIKSDSDFVYTSTGLGVGISNPSQKLDVDGAIAFDGQLHPTSTYGVTINRPTGYLRMGSQTAIEARFETDTTRFKFSKPVYTDSYLSAHDGLRRRSHYDDARTLYDPTNGILIRTDIRTTDSSRMFTLRWRTNSYRSYLDPGDTIVQGYWFTGQPGLINCSATASGGSHDIYVFFDGGDLCFWTQQNHTFSTFSNFSLNTHQGSHSITSITNAAKPGSPVYEVALTPSERWTSRNDGAGSGMDADLLDGEQGTYYLDLANSTGTLSVPRGGTGAVTHGVNQVLLGDGTSPIKSDTDFIYTATGLGIGISNPAHKLHLSGAIGFDGNVHPSSPYGLIVNRPSGYVRIGAQNASYAHLMTDRPAFHFDKGLSVSGNIVRYGNTSNMSLQAGSAKITLQNTSNRIDMESDVYIKEGLRDSSLSLGTAGYILSSSGSGVDWIDPSTVTSTNVNVTSTGANTEYVPTLVTTTGQVPLYADTTAPNITMNPSTGTITSKTMCPAEGELKLRKWTQISNAFAGMQHYTHTGLEYMIVSDGTDTYVSAGAGGGKVYLRPNAHNDDYQITLHGLSWPTVGEAEHVIWHAGNDGAGSGLDSDLLDGQQGSYYLAAANQTGVHTVPQGGTGLSSIPTGRVVYGQGTSAMGHSANLQYDSANARLGIAATPTATLHVGGNSQLDGTITGPASEYGTVTVQTPTGYLRMGSQNTGTAHFYTDRNNYFFNKTMFIDGYLCSYNQDMILRTQNATRLSLSNTTGEATFYHPANFSQGIRDSASNLGTSGQLLSSSGSGVTWIDAPDTVPSQVTVSSVDDANEYYPVFVSGAGTQGLKADTTSPRMRYRPDISRLTMEGSLELFDSTHNLVNQLRVGRSVSEMFAVAASDNVIQLSAFQDTDGNDPHYLVIDRTFGGTGGSYLDIRNSGTTQMRMYKDGKVAISDNVNFTAQAQVHIEGPAGPSFGLGDDLLKAGDTLLVTGGGQVAIGSPAQSNVRAQLHVAGTSSGQTFTGTETGVVFENDGTLNTTYGLQVASASGFNFSVTDNKRVGIGRQSPEQPLDIQTASTNEGIRLRTPSHNYWDILTHYGVSNADLKFVPGGATSDSTRQIQFSAAGQLSVGYTNTTTTGPKMAVNGPVAIGDNSTYSGHMLDIQSTAGSAGYGAIRAQFPAGGSLTDTEFAALAHRGGVWSSVYAKQGSAYYAGFFEGDLRITGHLRDEINSGGAIGDVLTATSPGTRWVSPSTLASSLDHGSLLGLSDNDHPQYGLRAGDTYTGTDKHELPGSGSVKMYRNLATGRHTGSTTRYIVIKFPHGFTSTMWSLKVIGASYSSTNPTWEITASAYSYDPDNTYYNHQVQATGGLPKTALVRFARETATDKMCLIIAGAGTTLSYPAVWVDSFLACHSAVDSWENGWSVTFESDISAYTINNTHQPNFIAPAGSAAEPGVEIGATSKNGFYSYAGGDLRAVSGEVEVLRLIKDGSDQPRLGVGGVNPTRTLDVDGDTVFGATNRTRLKTYHDSAFAGIYIGSSLSDEAAVYMSDGAIHMSHAGVPLVSAKSTNQVGIKNPNPSATLDVAGNAIFGHLTHKRLKTYHDNSYTGFYAGSSLADETAIYMNHSNIYLSQGGTNHLVVQSNGRVGIGTGASTSTLDVAGDVRIRGGTPAVGNVLMATSTDGTATWSSVPQYNANSAMAIAPNTPATWYRMATWSDSITSLAGAATFYLRVTSGNGNYAGSVIFSVSHANRDGDASRRINVISANYGLAIKRIRFASTQQDWTPIGHIDVELMSGSTSSNVTFYAIDPSNHAQLPTPVANPDMTGLQEYLVESSRESFYDLEVKKDVRIGNTRIAGTSSGGAATIHTDHGHLTVGPLSSNWCHMTTSAPAFYFDKKVVSGEGIFGTNVGDNLRLQTNGTTRLFARESDGFVGIGTENPSTELHVDGQVSIVSGSTIGLLNPSQGAIVINGTLGIDANEMIADADMHIGVTSGKKLVFTHGAATMAAFDVNRNFGIDTSVPSERLDVNGNMRLRGHFYDSINTSGVSGQVLTRGAAGPEWSNATASTVTVTENNADATFYPTFVSGAGTLQQHVDTSTDAVRINPAKGELESKILATAPNNTGFLRLANASVLAVKTLGNIPANTKFTLGTLTTGQFTISTRVTVSGYHGTKVFTIVGYQNSFSVSTTGSPYRPAIERYQNLKLNIKRVSSGSGSSIQLQLDNQSANVNYAPQVTIEALSSATKWTDESTGTTVVPDSQSVSHDPLTIIGGEGPERVLIGSQHDLNTGSDVQVVGRTLLRDEANVYHTWLPYADDRAYIAGKDIVFRTTGAAERMRILDNGFVGINTQDPVAQLEIESTTDTSQNLQMWGNRIGFTRSGPSYIDFGLNSGSLGSLAFRANSSHDEVMRLTGNGRVGIGISTPDDTLDVQGTTRLRGNVRIVNSGALTISSSNDTAMSLDATDNSWKYIQWQHSGTRLFYTGLDATGKFTFGADNAGPQVYHFSSSDVGIRTSTPTRSLDVNGSARVRSNLWIGQHLEDSTGTTGTTGQVLNRGASGVEWTSTIPATSVDVDVTTSNSTFYPTFVTNSGDQQVYMNTLLKYNPAAGLLESHRMQSSQIGLGERVTMSGASIYHFNNGMLIRTNIPASTNTMIQLTIEQHSHNSNAGPGKLMVQAYNYTSTGTIIAVSGTAFGGSFGDVKVFHEGGFVCFWTKQPNNYQSYNNFKLTTSLMNDPNILSVHNVDWPTITATNVVDVPVRYAMVSEGHEPHRIPFGSGSFNWDNSNKLRFEDGRGLILGEKTQTSSGSYTENQMELTPPYHTGGPFIVATADTASDAFIRVSYGSNNTLSLEHSGKLGVGVGAEDPAAHLHARRTNEDPELRLDSGNTTYQPRIRLFRSTTYWGDIRYDSSTSQETQGIHINDQYDSVNAAVRIGTRGNETLRVQNDYVGFGLPTNQTAEAPVHIRQKVSSRGIRIQAPAHNYWDIYSSYSYTNSDLTFMPQNGTNANMLRLSSIGQMSLGYHNTATNGPRLSVNGTLGVGTNAAGSSNHMIDVNSVKGNSGNSAIRAIAPNGGSIISTSEFAAIAHRNSVWSTLYAKQGTATYAGYLEGHLRVTGKYVDSANAGGTSGQVLSSTGTGTAWIDAPSGSADDITITTTSANQSLPILLSTGSGTNRPIQVDSGSALHFNPSTNKLTVSGETQVTSGFYAGRTYHSSKAAYNYFNGVLIRTNIPPTDDVMFTMECTINGYGAHGPGKLLVQGYQYLGGGSLINAKASLLSGHDNHNRDVKLFRENGSVSIWIEGDPSDLYLSYSNFQLTATTGANVPYKITSISHAAMPTSGVTHVTTRTPHQHLSVESGVVSNGRVPFGNGTTELQTNANLTFDASAGRLGVGTSSPQARLDVRDDGYQLRVENEGTGGAYWNMGASRDAWATGGGGDFYMVPNSATSTDYKFRFKTTGGFDAVGPVRARNGKLQLDNWVASSTYQGLFHEDMMSGNGYMIMSQGTNTYISCGVGGAVYLRADGNDAAHQIALPANGEPHIGTSASNKIWHAGNDGAGSGLDADLLDGQTSSHYLNYNNYMYRQDNRTIAPNECMAGGMRFGFTSWANNSTSPYADFLHMRSYTDGSGGLDNLIMFKKNGFGIRQWQQTWGSSTAYSNYVDFWHTGNDGSGSGLDADLLDGQHGSHYLDLANMTGVLPVSKGGTGLSSVTTGRVLFGNSATTLTTSSNLQYDSANVRLGIGTPSPQKRLHVSGDALITHSLDIFDPSTSALSRDRIRVGRGSNEHFSVRVDDLYTYLIAKQDSDGNSVHGMILDRQFNGTGESFFDIRNFGQIQARFNKDGNVIFSPDGNVTPVGHMTVRGDFVSGRVAYLKNLATSMSSNAYALDVDNVTHTTNVSAGGAFRVRTSTQNHALVVNGHGRVGIGIQIPSVQLQTSDVLGVGTGATADAMLDVASIKGGSNQAAIRALYPGGGGLANTQFAALAHRGGVWNALYAQQGSATNALYVSGLTNFQGHQRTNYSSWTEREGLYTYRNLRSLNQTPGVTGALLILLPKHFTPTMWTMKVCGFEYNYNNSWELRVGAYSYGNSDTFIYPIAETSGQMPSNKVRFIDAGTKIGVVIGDTTTTWSYPAIHVDTFTTAYAAKTDWQDGWSMSFITSLSGYTVKNTIEATMTTNANLLIGGSGRLGVGVSSPSQSIHTDGNLQVDGSIRTQSKSGVPSTGNIESGFFHAWKDTTTGDISLYTNDGGTIKEVNASANRVTGINAVSGSSYTLALSDAGKYVRCTNSSPVTITVPTHAAAPIPVRTVITLRQAGTGQITVVGQSGVTLNGNNKSPEQHQSFQLIKIGGSEWDVEGGVS